MAFQADKLELLAGGGTVLNLWGYATDTDDKSAVNSGGYFNLASGMLKVGDWVFVNGADGQALAIVSSNAEGTIDTTLFFTT